MDSKKTLAVVLLPFLLVFCGICGMDQPKTLKEDVLAKEKDPGIFAINLANNYFKAQSNDEKRKAIGSLCQYLKELHKDNLLRLTSVDETSWINTFCDWSLQADESKDQIVQGFKIHIYKTYYPVKEKEFICSALQSTVNELQQNKREETNYSKKIKKSYIKDVKTIFSVLLNELPDRRKEINDLINDLDNLNDYKSLVQEIEDICEEGAKVRTGSDIKKVDPWKQLTEEDLGKKIEQLSDVFSNLPKISSNDLPEDIFGRLKSLISHKYKLEHIKRQAPDNEDVDILLKSFTEQLDNDAGVIIKNFVKNWTPYDVVYQYFPPNNRELNKYFDQFLWKNFKAKLFVEDEKKDTNYFKKFDQFLIGLQKSGKVTEADQYKKILDLQATLVVATAITSQPAAEQINYFDMSENLKFYWDLQNEIQTLNMMMYDPSQRTANILLLGVIRKLVRKVLLLNNDGLLYITELKNDLAMDCLKKIDYMITILKTWQELEENKSEAAAIATIVISGYVEDLNSNDIKNIEELIRNSQFTDFYENKFYTLSEPEQKIYRSFCEKIQKTIPEFPVPIEQAQSLSEQSVQPISKQQLVESPVSGVMSSEMPQEPMHGRPRLAELFALQEQRLQQIWQQRQARQEPVAPPVHQPAGDEPQGFIARMATAFSAAFSELINTISEKISQIWQLLRG